MVKIKLWGALLILILTPQITPLLAFDHQHQKWQEILKGSVIFQGNKSSVDYSWIKTRQQTLDSYTEAIENITRSEYDSWTDDQRLAFLINAYNALTIQLILTKYPDLDSIKDIGTIFNSPWKKKFFNLLEENQHLDFIEHQILRKDFNDPRIHFAIVCASIGCPPLQQTAYVAESVDQQLEKATINFLSDSDRNRWNQDTGILELSPIFKWFKEDFEKKAGSVEAFVLPYLIPDKNRLSAIDSSSLKIKYLGYDWSLNDR